jgi:hypothetical protein
MPLAPANEGVKKNLETEKIIHHNPRGHERCKDSITIKEA